MLDAKKIEDLDKIIECILKRKDIYSAKVDLLELPVIHGERSGYKSEIFKTVEKKVEKALFKLGFIDFQKTKYLKENKDINARLDSKGNIIDDIQAFPFNILDDGSKIFITNSDWLKNVVKAFEEKK